MDRSGLTGHAVFYVALTVIGSAGLVWFGWPAVCKGVLNAGNLCGMAGAVLMIVYGVRHQAVNAFAERLWEHRAARICILVSAVLVLAGVVLMILAAVSIVRAASTDIPDDTPAVVLGCSVKGTRPSRALQERIDAAYVYMQENPGAVCVLSGGKGKGEDISEAECMYQYLVKAGAEPDRLYLESASTDTRENLEYSKKILDRLGKPEAVTVISSEFHLYRGEQWAKKLGYETYGYAAHTDLRYLPTYFLREIIAVVHLWLTAP